MIRCAAYCTGKIRMKMTHVTHVTHVTYAPCHAMPKIYYFGHPGCPGCRCQLGPQVVTKGINVAVLQKVPSIAWSVGRCWKILEDVGRNIFEHTLISLICSLVATFWQLDGRLRLGRLDLLSTATPEVYVRCATGCSESSRGPAWPVFLYDLYGWPNWTCKQQLNKDVKRRSLNMFKHIQLQLNGWSMLKSMWEFSKLWHFC